MHVAHVDGFGRRWNYGSKVLRGDWVHDGKQIESGLVVSLGVVAAEGDSCNGVVFDVDDDELAALDWRERDYERVDITDLTTVEVDQFDGRVEVYVPRPSSIERYELARDAGRAAIRQSYWTLVEDAFASLGDHHAELYARTPAPDIPVADITLRPLN
jgi:cation transport regulator ChaC